MRHIRPTRPIVYRSPVGVMEGASPATLPRVARAIAVATLTMLLLGSKALLDWASDLPVNAASDALLDWAGRWNDWMAAIGLDGFAATLHEWLEAFRRLR